VASSSKTAGAALKTTTTTGSRETPSPSSDAGTTTETSSCPSTFTTSSTPGTDNTEPPADTIVSPSALQEPPKTYLEKLQAAVHATGTLEAWGYVFGTYSKHRNFPARDFKEAPSPSPFVTKRQAVALDCEMVLVGVKGNPQGTNHNALARITAIDALTGEVLIDAVVGTLPHRIINWNSEVSGIHPESYNATLRRGYPEAFKSWQAARKELFRLIDKDTVLVGHAMDNDLKVLRVSHARCVDSGILACHAWRRAGNRGKRQFGLRDLTWQFCRRWIQSSGGGHCSREDTLATMDLVRVFVEEPERLDGYMRDQY